MEPTSTKKCPLCAEQIDAPVALCPYCGARFEITRRGYCAHCHEIVTPVATATCPACGGPLIDETVDSRFLGEGPLPELPGSVPAAPAWTVAEPDRRDLEKSLGGWNDTGPGATPGQLPPEGPALPAAAPYPAPGLGGEAPAGRRPWLPWVIAAAAVVVLGGAGVLGWWLTRDTGSGGLVSPLTGEPIPTRSIPAEEVDPLSVYLAKVLQAEAPVGRASVEANAATTAREAADAQTALAAAFGIYRTQVASLDPPQSAEEHQDMVLEVADAARDLYMRVAAATRDGDTAALIGLQSDLVSWMDLALEEAAEREILINTALSADAAVPLNRYLLDTGAVRSDILDELQAFLTRVQTALAAGQWQATLDQIDDEFRLLDDFLTAWEGVTPPPEAADYHTTQADAIGAIRDELAVLRDALEAQDVSGLQDALLGLLRAAADAQEALLLRNGLLLQALGGAGQAFALAGEWSGMVSSAYSPLMPLQVTFNSVCSAGQVCGNFELPDLPCSGSFTYVGRPSPAAPFEFHAGDLQGNCGVGRDFFKLLPDGSLQYTSVGDYGTETGVLNRVNP